MSTPGRMLALGAVALVALLACATPAAHARTDDAAAVLADDNLREEKATRRTVLYVDSKANCKRCASIRELASSLTARWRQAF